MNTLRILILSLIIMLEPIIIKNFVMIEKQWNINLTKTNKICKIAIIKILVMQYKYEI